MLSPECFFRGITIITIWGTRKNKKIRKKTKKTFSLLRIVGHKGSEITGPAFNPSGKRLYFNSQRGKKNQRGITYEVTGPFEKYA